MQLLDGKLSPTDEHKVLTHLRTCPECLGLTADLLYTDDRLKELFSRQDEQKEKPKRKDTDQFMLEIDKLPIGKSMDRDLLDEDGKLLVSAGTELTPILIESLKRRGIEKLAIETPRLAEQAGPEEVDSLVINIYQIESFLAENGITPAVSAYVRRQCSEALDTCFRNLEENGVADVRQLQEAAQELTEEILANTQIALTLADLILVDPGLHAHSVNVMILFLMIARAMGHPVKLIRDHSTAALLHDIGRIILRAVDQKKTQEEIEFEHSEAGYNYLWNMGSVNESALKMVMNHHEQYDGNGYPRKIKGTMLSDWDQILILSNTYDNLTWNKQTGVRSGFHEALSSIIRVGTKSVRKGIIRMAIQTFGHYPPGSWVKLNSGEIGLVASSHPGNPLKPTITIIYDSAGRKQSKPKFIDLTHSQNTYILGPVSVQMR
ncbi:MAG: HD domain-containing protein [bacterium]|nr:HD domain-containing protein [bacterium]